MNIDYQELNLSALPHIESIVREMFPQGKKSGREWKIGSLSGESGTSMSINLQTGLWSDFATGDKGDILGLVSQARNVPLNDAAEWLAARVGQPVRMPSPAPSKVDEWQPLPFSEQDKLS